MSTKPMKTKDSNFPVQLFHQGKAFDAYKHLGGHYLDQSSTTARFRVWAPRAVKVSLVGDFNGWDINHSPMTPLAEDPSIWQINLDGLEKDAMYKYAITTDKGDVLFKADPYAFMSEPPSNTVVSQMASQFHPLDYDFPWQDQEWMNHRSSINPYKSPINIYEVHLGSWQFAADGSTLGYREMAHKLVKYANDMGYTHIEIMPLMEHPFDGSWGYQVCGYFSITSRFGKPDDFMYLVNHAHQMGIGVILDWVPAHFPKDAHGLIEFDGHPLYEDKDVLRMEHKGWGTRVFDYGRPEVLSFLVSNACFYFDKYHIDGLRVDAVAAMLYLDYDREHGQWRPNAQGGRENMEAIHFLKTLNTQVLTTFPGVLMIAEESTAWPLVTMPPDVNGLGFNFKWNMGWMNDILEYISADPLFRGGIHDKLTFPLMYAFSENYVLPISHDEVVHGKKSLLEKMPGTYEEKFAGVRLFITHMLTQPGKKLIFMGSEIGQFNEWSEAKSLDWKLLDFTAHKKLKNFFKEANQLYLDTPAMWQCDDSWEGFQWIDADNKDDNVITFIRKTHLDPSGDQLILVAENFSGATKDNYKIGVPSSKVYTCIFDTDMKRFGGKGSRKKKEYIPQKGGWNGFEYYITVKLPPLSAIILKQQ